VRDSFWLRGMIAGRKSALDCIKGSTLKVYPGLSHGMSTINADQINADLLSFIKA
jgi:non-heme chloroperoxidase